ncbi:MAG: 3-oxoadipate--succinyl-CoA transferase subunit A [Balneola sp.]|nr:3-oxoadipate--succinyl-CoA transferase subunit A [Balneola sp.]|tara:strand:+ start:84835 stop:85695 length:861 start_codon:yes stop_codon:yes gene_type:complete
MSDKIIPLEKAIADHIQDRDEVALEGFTHLIPFAAGHEIIRQQKKDLTLIRMTPDLIYDQMIGMGMAKKLVFSWGGNPGVGSLHRLRDSIENGFPHTIEIEEHSHADISSAYVAGASGLPFTVLRGYTGTDLAKQNPEYVKWIECPFTGEKLAATPAFTPNVTVIHAQQADRKGNVKLWGIIGVQKEAAMAAKKIIVTVEEIVDSFEDGDVNATIIPHWLVTAISEVPGGSKPSYAMGYYKRNNEFYKQWDEISQDRDRFHEWMDTYVTKVENFNEHLQKLEVNNG